MDRSSLLSAIQQLKELAQRHPVAAALVAACSLPGLLAGLTVTLLLLPVLIPVGIASAVALVSFPLGGSHA